MFTGLMPSEHCTHNDHKRLDDRYDTVAELLGAAGYQTFLYSANPHITGGSRNFDQGFDVASRPYSSEWSSEAERVIREKLDRDDRSSEFPARFRAADRGRTLLNAWDLKAAGSVAEKALLEWLEASDPERPYFAFLNYMEAHPPYIPSREHRRRLMSEEDVGRSYRVDRSWLRVWEYTFGLAEFSDEELELTRATYDATLGELDDLFAELLETLDDEGFLDNTVVVLTSDHGEHLGEQHMLDHQYSLYEPILRVPLVIHFPSRFAPGRDDRPVMNMDVFATLLELAGLEIPAGTRAVSLLDPEPSRVRLAEEPARTTVGMPPVQQRHPDWDPSPYQRQIRALTDSPHKYIWGSDGRNALFDLEHDPGEERNRIEDDAEVAARLAAALEKQRAGLARCDAEADEIPVDSPDERQLLEELGYVESDEPESSSGK
jgi:arylsulfatase A-like enzyme